MNIIYNDLRIILQIRKEKKNLLLLILLLPIIYKLKIIWYYFILSILIKIIYYLIIKNEIKQKKINTQENFILTLYNLSTQIAIILTKSIKEKKIYTLFNKNYVKIISFRILWIFIFGVNIKYFKIWIYFVSIFLKAILILKHKSYKVILVNILNIINKSANEAIKKEYNELFYMF